MAKKITKKNGDSLSIEERTQKIEKVCLDRIAKIISNEDNEIARKKYENIGMTICKCISEQAGIHRYKTRKVMLQAIKSI